MTLFAQVTICSQMGSNGSAKTGTGWNDDRRYIGTYFTSRRTQSRTRKSPPRPQLPGRDRERRSGNDLNPIFDASRMTYSRGTTGSIDGTRGLNNDASPEFSQERGTRFVKINCTANYVFPWHMVSIIGGRKGECLPS